MLDQIIRLVQDQAQDYFIQNPDVPNEQAQDAAQAAGASLLAAFQHQIASGNAVGLQNMLSGGQVDAGMMQQIVQQATGLLGGHLQQQGLSSTNALSASQGIMPTILQMVLGKYMSKAPGDSAFDAGSLIPMVLGGALGGNGGSEGGLGSLLGGLLGGMQQQQQKNRGGATRTDDSGGNDLLGGLLGTILGGGQQQSQQNQAGTDILSSILGNVLGKK